MTGRGSRRGALLASLGLLAAGCGILPASPPIEYHVGGVVSGLGAGAVVLTLAGGETLRVAENGRFRFSEPVQDGSVYAVTVAADASGPAQDCRVARGSGVVDGDDVDDVQVACSLVLGAFNLEWFGPDSSFAKKQGIADIVLGTGFAALGVEEVASPADLSAFAAQFLGRDWDWRLGASGYEQHVGLLYDTALVTVLESGELGAARSGGIIDPASDTWRNLRLPYYARVQSVDGRLELELLVVHFKAMSDADSCLTRRAQVVDVARWLALHESGPLAVVGDFNDSLPGNGICSTVDTLAPLEADPGLTFLTSQPDSMSSELFTLIAYRSTIDHVLATRSLASLAIPVDADGHKAAVVMDLDGSISDHQPPYVFLAW